MMTSLTSRAQSGYRATSAAISHTRSGVASMVMDSDAVSAMVSILADVALVCRHRLPLPRREPAVERRPEAIQPETEHRYEETERERRAGVAVGPVRPGEGGDARRHDLGQQGEPHPSLHPARSRW